MKIFHEIKGYSNKVSKNYNDDIVEILIRCGNKRKNEPPKNLLAKILKKLALPNDSLYWELKKNIWHFLQIKESPIRVTKERETILERNINNAAGIPILRKTEGTLLLNALNLSLKTNKKVLEEILIENILSSSEIENIVKGDLESLKEEENTTFEEGGRKSRYINYYERVPELRTKAIKFHGTKCQACEFDFFKTYGERGRDYIEVHHKKLLSTKIEKSKINPKTDMAVVCSNCHRMIHRKKDKILSIEGLKKIIIHNP